mmetsp:Transcript_9823/g.12288  ORF Transcript_9823/g.12288 Transcript_9823/m.12288 type:complete len:496 (-) Transcript_9823:236-1723(-)
MRNSIQIAKISSGTNVSRCTLEGCKRFVERYNREKCFTSIKNTGSGLKVSKIGFGSPWIGAPKVQSKKLTRTIQNGCNLIELTENNRVPPNREHSDDIDHWEMEAITRLMIEQKVQRDELMLLSRVPISRTPSFSDSESMSNLNPERIRLATVESLDFHGLECLDGLAVELPQMPKDEDPKLWQQMLEDSFQSAIAGLESLVRDQMIQTYGFYSKSTGVLDNKVMKHLVSQDAPNMGLAMFPMSPDRLGKLDQSTIALAKAKGIAILGDDCLHSKRKDGRPVTFIDVYPDKDTLSSRLENVFNKAMHMETEYMTRFLDKKEELGIDELPEAVDLCWAHILSQKQGQIHSLEEWMALKELQVLPTLDQSLDILKDKGNQATMDFGMLYRIVAFDLFETFTEMMEESKAKEVEQLISQLDCLAPELASLPNLSSRAFSLAISSGADCAFGQGNYNDVGQQQQADEESTPFEPFITDHFQLHSIPQCELKNIYQSFMP